MRRRAGTRIIGLAAALAVALLAIPGAASAADPPTILSAGIDAADRLYVTWRVGAGTTYDHAEFATAPAAAPEVPDSFLDANVVAFGCTDAPDVCQGTPQSTSLTVDYPVARDRRYFVKVAATVDGTERAMTASAVWVIDEAKPLIPGQPPQLPDGLPTNTPATGSLLAGSLPVTQPGSSAPLSSTGAEPAPQPRARIMLLSVPRTIGALLGGGVRMKVVCPRAPCSTTASLMLGTVSLASKRIAITRAGSRLVVLKPVGSARRRLSGRARARLRVRAAVTPRDGAPRRLSRFFTVRRAGS